ncbi:MAG: tRNA (cytidine(34)-2'-O)-methyltransferase [Candidatus Fonsibacter sp.]|jgi:tRNA (cytidine/uridine-2'-O-)-methyltransferase|uniref:tRNA (cytidine(34)-2'-O)-methyltransferase n=1 Tax=Candidatus Fonsibacter ubiquis TaxID=1925548 RepID=UPI000C07F59C|nr:tRNA (cytidine(34)-2'-O)-methyltransferase [Candidatus Fonsibacter ubiquis]MBU6305877.1 tRNA (cytidine(34)-2'-O)-methyltransferase [Pseudomonadota bacterium]GBL34320.1 tRNA (cytidine(34)-2'-O)-methyltransferase [Pelagibacterales bacterium]NCU44829.1 tRNA (cytidine(34)-2'-O)-methyltransferase [Candidatus Fonsibacter ubiquis]NCU45812.1 tRNA (cytidine(34)-2'-O)-methyltransferase [Candidatus Fonsibacter ubiquis]NCU47534.1 tRNA (cytidine(34)-2'-O)-methyltransferase [Candidatus Fonsibacter ubiqui
MYNIALFQPDIPQNTAATIRLCACLNVTLEIIEPCGFQFNEKKLKSIYMDYYEKCKIIRHLSFEDFIETKNNKRIILLTTKAKKIYYNFQFKRDDTILFGRESAGVPDSVHKIVNERLKIPISKDTRSLNVVTSVSIVLSEALRQNNYSNI